ncbi:hypothetical protein CMEL01_16383 [Colletotrichum melonis]|uniref:C2H2-type domain-containing protein n=1 Tax=Colletotrichum melonis TaxID=1209925 RepID=A0AAI9UDN9_9PEZI|nr:hypothetical protein CMEL01_16383 [Colletotrichum melonis]
MSSRCVTCNRSFGSEEALQQHMSDSPIHSPSYDCDICDRSFGNDEALQQHLRDSPVHKPSYDCSTCDRSFGNDEALEQHLRDSPVHKPSYDCDTCKRSFGDDEALQQHRRDSPVHRLSYDCESCNRSFGDEEALQQHLRDSPAHRPFYDCDTCNRSFSTEEALQQHLRDSSIHQQSTETPLDVFFRSYAALDYDRSLPPHISYANLQRHMGWYHRDQPASKEAWDKYQKALEKEFQMWFGEEDDLAAWHALCRAIGINPLPVTNEQCKKAVRRTHVNIVDLIESRRGNKEGVQTFRNVNMLRAYTKETNKIFPNKFHGENCNGVLRHLLRNIHRASL